MFATDFSPESQNAFEYAISLSKRYESKLFIAHALQTDLCLRGVEAQWQVHDLMQSNADRELAILEQRKDLKSLRHEIIVRSGEPSSVLLGLLSDENVDLIVMGTHGRGSISQLFLGSTAETVIRRATCSVLTVGPQVSRGAWIDSAISSTQPIFPNARCEHLHTHWLWPKQMEPS
jgi:nucleotide-binding universal stress UspA family protein